MTHTEAIAQPVHEKYVPRVFGFRVNEASLYYKLRLGLCTSINLLRK